MDSQHSIQSPSGSQEPAHSLRTILRDAIGYWEPRRVLYNAVLTAVVAAWVASTWPHFRPAVTPHSLVLLLVLAALANACYCAAYLTDLPMQRTPFQAAWRRGRWGLWVAGMFFAVALANYWIADEIYPYIC